MLDQQMLLAHESGDQIALIRMYKRAADLRQAAGDIDAACFYLTHAYVFALEQGDAMATELHSRLKAFGREE